MTLIKKSKQSVFKEAEERLNGIISHTSNLTEKDWENEDVQYSIKDALSQFVAFIKENNLDVRIECLRNFDILVECCIDGSAEDKEFTLMFLQIRLPEILKTITSKRSLSDSAIENRS